MQSSEAECPVEVAERSARKRLSSTIWEKHRSTIVRLYLQDGERLEDVMQYMETHENFKATEAAYKNKLRRWRVMKRKNQIQIPTASGIQSLQMATPDQPAISSGDNEALLGARGHVPSIQPAGAMFCAPEMLSNSLNTAHTGLDLFDPFEVDFNDESSQETELLLHHLSTIIHSSVNAGGFAQQVTAENCEDLFTISEKQCKLELLERVLAADILLLGARSSIFRCHARRFSDLAGRIPNGYLAPTNLSIFGRALQIVSGSLSTMPMDCCHRHGQKAINGDSIASDSCSIVPNRLQSNFDRYPLTLGI